MKKKFCSNTYFFKKEIIRVLQLFFRPSSQNVLMKKSITGGLIEAVVRRCTVKKMFSREFS